MNHLDFATCFRGRLFVMMFCTGIFAAAEQENLSRNANSVIGPIFKQYIDAGTDYIEQGQSVAGKMQQIRSEAEKGDSTAQFLLGKMYAERWGVQLVDAVEAVKWYRKSAEQGNAYGCVNLGFMYANGYGVSKDEAEAVKWFRKSAEQGNANGCINLGSMYAEGRGVPKDKDEAAKWYQKAADQGNAAAKSFLDNQKALIERMARLKDEGSGKFGGPNTQTVIDLTDLIATYPNPLIRRGAILESAGGFGIPAGTTLYPIKIADQKDGNLMSLTYYFYTDSFGDWKAVNVKN